MLQSIRFNLKLIKDRLHEVNKKNRISLTIISNSKQKYDEVVKGWSIPTYYVEWANSTFSRIMSQHDIAVIPISSNPFTICKTNNRVATALLHGLGVIADTIPSYRALSDFIVLDDWDNGFDKLINDHLYREDCVSLGQQKIIADWSLEKIVDNWMKVISEQEN